MKPQTETDYIQRLIAEGEHVRQDFKFEISDARKIARTLSAFANTSGGRLLVGVKDNGKIAGVRSEEEAYMIEAAARMYCRPAAGFSIRNYHVEGRNVLLAEIEESMQKPVYAMNEQGKALAYVRIGDENILASTVHLEIWKQNEAPKGTLVEFTPREQRLLDSFGQQELLSLGRICRITRLPRRTAEILLAKLIRFDIAEPVFRDHKFSFRLKG